MRLNVKRGLLTLFLAIEFESRRDGGYDWWCRQRGPVDVPEASRPKWYILSPLIILEKQLISR
jgi:hypothetical protein